MIYANALDAFAWDGSLAEARGPVSLSTFPLFGIEHTYALSGGSIDVDYTKGNNAYVSVTGAGTINVLNPTGVTNAAGKTTLVVLTDGSAITWDGDIWAPTGALPVLPAGTHVVAFHWRQVNGKFLGVASLLFS
jgi:hypothetical protein